MNLFADLVQHHIYRGQPVPIAAGYDYLLAGNGLFKRAENSYIRACLPLSSGPVSGLPAYEAVIHLKTGPIPARLLQAVLLDAQGQARRRQEQTYLFRVRAGGEYHVSRPAQKTNAARVWSYSSQGYDNVICEIHSHNTMPAFFSPTDDGDELGFRVYAVLGRVLTKPEIRVRLGLHGDVFPIPAALIFSDLGHITDCLEADCAA